MRTQSAFPPFPATRSHHLTKNVVSRDGTSIAPPSPPLMESFHIRASQVTFQASRTVADNYGNPCILFPGAFQQSTIAYSPIVHDYVLRTTLRSVSSPFGACRRRLTRTVPDLPSPRFPGQARHGCVLRPQWCSDAAFQGDCFERRSIGSCEGPDHLCSAFTSSPIMITSD